MRSLPASKLGRLPRSLWVISVLLAGLACAWYPFKAVDLRVYYETARSFFDRSGPMYGPNDVFGWPMIYRYPPLFLCLFRPLAFLPLAATSGLWAGLKIFLLGPLIWLWYRRFPPTNFLPALSVSALLVMPYLVQELKIGSVQLFIVEFVCCALLLCDEHPYAGSLLLGLAAAIKVWPMLLFPFLALRGRWRFGFQALSATALLTVAPACLLGWRETFHLLGQWFAQEQRINALLGDKWYPSQSLRGVMLRYLTRMDYSGLPDGNYRHVNFFSFAPAHVRHLWLVVALLLVLLSLVWIRRSADEASAYSLFFCFLLITLPNVHRLVYVTLLWPSLFAGILMTDPKTPRFTRWMLTGAAALAVLLPLVPGSSLQRFAQVLGVDFIFVLLPLTLALLSFAFCQYRLRRTRAE